jgi:hypothetical protein
MKKLLNYHIVETDKDIQVHNNYSNDILYHKPNDKQRAIDYVNKWNNHWLEIFNAPEIDISKPLKTRSGKRVINVFRITHNDKGEEVTYPLKGTIVLSEKPMKVTYHIWSNEGFSDIVFRNMKDKDLVYAYYN